MNNTSSWEAQTKELISRTNREIEEFKAETETHIAMLQQRKWALEEALRAYGIMMGSEATRVTWSLRRTDIKDKSYKEILRLIAQRNNGLLIVRTAITVMKEFDVFANPLNADSVVYSTLSRSRDFVKVGKGVYKLNGTYDEPKTSIRKEKIPGLKQAILELKTVNPDMIKQDIRDTLVKRGFDFQGKNPNKSIHMLWVNLGYAKKDKEAQQNLFGAN